MQNASTFQVYNASAGSGKTFTLVKEYLKLVLNTEDRYKFQQILAITFTNRAAAEMKERIMNNLQFFSEGKENDLFFKLIEETALDKTIIQKRSAIILDTILRDYSAFSITTIDSFTHKIIKSFAFDLGLNLNFEVELDADSLLQEAVDILITKVGVQKDITSTLIDYSLEKAQDDKSWDISRDLNDFAKILLRDEDTEHFKNLNSKTIKDFVELKNKLKKTKNKLDQQFTEIGEKGLQMIETMNLNHNDFYYSLIPKHFLSLKTPEKAKFFDQSKLKERIEERTFYAKSKSDDLKAAIEGVLPDLLNLYNQSEGLYQQYTLTNLALKSLVPLAVLTKINTELSTIKQDNNIRLISEFNQLISNNIQNEPAPFIYEKIGHKFMHYFIDEMQDTSVLQWKNLIPLIDNVLSQENSNLLLVGDGKQAIYRWRGSRAEQFIELGSNQENSINANPFQIPKTIEGLETNFRSFSEVISFNNSFFQYVSGYFNNSMYQELFFQGNQQKINHREGGFVSIDFLEKEEDLEKNNLKYAKKVYEVILNLDEDFSRKDVCILVRKKKEGVVVANYLSEQGIEIVSSETLLLQNSSKVNFIINLLQVINHPKDESTKVELLYFLHKHLQVNQDKHTFLKSFDLKESTTFFSKLKQFSVDFDVEKFLQLPFYEKIEEIIRRFHLAKQSDAYIQFFLEVVYEQENKQTDIEQFLDFWQQKKDKLSIVAPASENAVQIMTIHKSKGLEFPVVIFPYNIKIYDDRNQKSWVSNLPSDSFNGFDELLINSNKSIKYTGKEGESIYSKQREESELDNFNLLYVALTRTIEQLYIITDKTINSKGVVDLGFTSGILMSYLNEKGLWSETKDNYQFGNPKKQSKKKIEESKSKIQKGFISNSWKQHNIYMLANSSKLWDTDKGMAIEYGNLIHQMFAEIYTERDLSKVINKYIVNGVISEVDAIAINKMIAKVIHHPKLKEYYTDDNIIFNEREIKTSDNKLIIPDRLIFKDNKVTIIDYKTGKPSKSYHQQLNQYQQVLESLGFNVIKKLLIYINEEIEVEEI